MTPTSFETVIGPKDPEETVSVTFPFAKEALPGATCLSAVVEVSVLEGYDPTPSSMLFMAPDSSGFPVISQAVTGGVSSTTYLLKCRATLSSGQVLCRKAVLLVSSR